MNGLSRTGCITLMLASAVSPAFAQSTALDGARFEVSAGIVRIGRSSFGGRDAQETTGTAAGGFRLFSSSSELGAASGFGARVAVAIVRSIEAELSGTYSTPELRTRIDSDVEASNAPLVATVVVQQFTFGGAAVWYPRQLPRLPSRMRPFLRGGAGLERHLEDRGRRVVDGRAFEAGGGLKYLFAARSRGWWKAIGARADALALVRSGAVTLDGRAHVSPILGASAFLRF